MTTTTTDDILAYLANLVEKLEHFAVTVLPPDDREEISLGQERNGNLIIDLEARFPAPPGSDDVELDLFERWRSVEQDVWMRIEYKYELRHRELGYRRAFHRHHADHFVRMRDVATHEHCESTLGIEACDHYYGEPVADAFDGFERLYDLWLTDRVPDCSLLNCLG